MPRLVNGDTRTDEIIRGIGRLIVSGGLDAVTMRRIAHEVGVSTGTLCHHYESRERLMRVAVYWFGKEFVAENESRVRHEGPSGFLPSGPQDVARTRIWLAFAELGRTSSDLGRQVDEARAHERWLLAGCAMPRLDPLAAVGAYATLEGLRAAICTPGDALPLPMARNLLAKAL